MKLTLSAGPTSETILVMCHPEGFPLYAQEYAPETPIKDVMLDVRTFLSTGGRKGKENPTREG